MPSSSNYCVIEPHPSVPHTERPAIHTSRGGAGNVINLKNTKTTDSRTATGPASLTRLDSRSSPTYKSGRGGAGNVHNSSERAIFSFDEELEREMRRAAPVYHVGRGGAGNMIFNDDRLSRYTLTRKQSSGSTATASSSESTAEKAKRSISQGWTKLRAMA